MFGINAKSNRSTKHTHEFIAHGIGADLQRQVCSGCGQVSINALPPTGLRPLLVDVRPVLFSQPELTVGLDAIAAPLGLSRRFGERRARR